MIVGSNIGTSITNTIVSLGHIRVGEEFRRAFAAATIHDLFNLLAAAAAPCGYWYHRELTKRGAVNYVVAPRLLENQRSKRQKTDRLDARALLGNLESYLRVDRSAAFGRFTKRSF